MAHPDMKKRIIPVVLLLLLAGGAYWWWSSSREESGPGDVNVLGGNGTIEAEQVTVTSRIAGRIVKAPRNEGVRVKKGQALYRLDPTLLRLQVDQAGAGEAAAWANYRNVRNDDDSTRADVAAAKAQLDQARIARRMAKVQHGYATIKAPVSGLLSSIALRAGENATPGTPLAVVSDTDKPTVTIFIPEPRIGDIKIGQEARLTTDSSDKSYKAEVVFVATDAEFAPSTLETKDQRVKLVYQVKLGIVDADETLKAGMPADVRF